MEENTEKESPQKIAERIAKESDKLKIAYKATFSSDKGRMVWLDLKAKFGFNRWAAQDTEDTEKIMRRVFMQGPLFHIETMQNAPLSETKKRQRKEKQQNLE